MVRKERVDEEVSGMKEERKNGRQEESKEDDGGKHEALSD